MFSNVERRFLTRQRVAHLATADRRAVPHVVPACFAIFRQTLYITIDDKPKRVSGLALSVRATPSLRQWRLRTAPLLPFASSEWQAGATYPK